MNPDADRDWQAWARTWQQQPASFDVSALAARVRRRRRAMWAGLALEVVGTLLVTVLVAWLWRRSDGDALRIWSLLALGLVWAFQLSALGLRRSLLSSQSLDPAALLDWLQARARSRIRYVWLSLIGVSVLLVLTLCSLWPAPLAQAMSWNGGVGTRALSITVAVLATGVWARRALRQQYAELRSIRAQREEL